VDVVRERHEHRSVGSAEVTEKRVSSGLQVLQRRSRDAVAHVEHQRDAERLGFSTNDIDLLAHAVVEELEVVPGQALHRLSVSADEDVDTDGIDFDAIMRPLLRLGGEEPGDGRDPKKFQRATSSRSRFKSGNHRPQRPRS